MAEWNPEQYLQFKNDRLRPAYDLLERVNINNPEHILDLGCGPATSTRLLGERFPDAKLVGVDNSEKMISEARDNYSKADYLLEDLERWHHKFKADIVFANAVFHWLPDHRSLISKLADMLEIDGALAFQMPDNLSEPSHIAIAKLVAMPEWVDVVGKEPSSRGELGTIAQYYDWMIEHFQKVDIWRTTYAHIMPSHNHIVEWVKGAALTPYLGKMNDAQTVKFLRNYQDEIVEAYPLQADGSVIFHFPRLFVVGCNRR